MIFAITFAALVVLLLTAVVSTMYIIESAVMLSGGSRDRKYWLMELGLGLVGWISIVVLIAYFLA